MSLRCKLPYFSDFRSKTSMVQTRTSEEQAKVELDVEKFYEEFLALLESEQTLPELHRTVHESFLHKGLHHLSNSYECLDASRPWLCYWILHSLKLLNLSIPDDTVSSVAQFLGKCQLATGGFGGGPGQVAHLAPTYAAVNALCTLGTEEAYKVIDRKALQSYLMSMKEKNGAFRMHADGEVDIRGAYCAASIAFLTNVATIDMFDGTAEWIVRCQTYEGGFGGCPGMEAHGGYSFCGLAALVLLGRERLCDIKSLLRWAAFKQMSYEGGFQGRTNKLVDGCYSFWQGGIFPLIHKILSKMGDAALSSDRWMFHQGALQEYLLICCQHPNGGLLDKPGKPRDFYHTCYCLSGLSVAQHFSEGRLVDTCLLGDTGNELKCTHPVFNIVIGVIHDAMQFFSGLEVPQ